MATRQGWLELGQKERNQGEGLSPYRPEQLWPPFSLSPCPGAPTGPSSYLVKPQLPAMFSASFLTIPITAGTHTALMGSVQTLNAHPSVPHLHGSICMEYPPQPAFYVSTCSHLSRPRQCPHFCHMPHCLKLEVLSLLHEVLGTESAFLLTPSDSEQLAWDLAQSKCQQMFVGGMNGCTQPPPPTPGSDWPQV